MNKSSWENMQSRLTVVEFELSSILLCHGLMFVKISKVLGPVCSNDVF